MDAFGLLNLPGERRRFGDFGRSGAGKPDGQCERGNGAQEKHERKLFHLSISTNWKLAVDADAILPAVHRAAA
jgi:hypothetical protein